MPNREGEGQYMFPLRHVKPINASFRLAHNTSHGSVTQAQEIAICPLLHTLALFHCMVLTQLDLTQLYLFLVSGTSFSTADTVVLEGL